MLVPKLTSPPDLTVMIERPDVAPFVYHSYHPFGAEVLGSLLLRKLLSGSRVWTGVMSRTVALTATPAYDSQDAAPAPQRRAA